ncbi:unnamed protein product [Paramecium octaurelia]|uniref:Protein kinase domain-containing protein n=1 Tax=Paramecium octaurelia TaxID=43137 RepID=A0A8S1SL22_PAROT|nr:unnamed protein product [Paramecium octaurelia]
MKSKCNPQDKKLTVIINDNNQNISFDLNSNNKPKYYISNTTCHKDNQKFFNCSNMSPMVVETSTPRKRLVSGKRTQQKANCSHNNSNNKIQNRQKKSSSNQRTNLTVKTGSSIEALKELMGKSYFKQLLQINTDKFKNAKEIQFIETKKSNSSEFGFDNRFNKHLQQLNQQGVKTTTNKSVSKDRTSLQKVFSKIMDQEKSTSPIKKVDWSKIKLPLTPKDCIQQFGQYLSEFEKQEIHGFSRIYCIGLKAKKIDQKQSNYNDGFDDSKGEYLYSLNDHIGYRYEILEIVGKGSFGQAFKVFDHKRQQVQCLKIIRNKKKFTNQALVELNILTYVKEKDEENVTNIVKIKDFVIFRNHVCISFEFLSINLYQLIKNNNFQSLSLELIRRFAIQILNALNFLSKHKIIHCDLKPENILLKQSNKSGIKIIDFGSSCFENQKIYSYIQSRYYRAPEVMFGIPYDTSIDMWSFGCIMAELYLGFPIFPGDDEQEQIAYILEILGMPDIELLQIAQRRKVFFADSPPFQPLSMQNKSGKLKIPGSKTLQEVLKCNDHNFIDFLKQCLVWNPKNRISPIDALMHVWILEGLPSQIRAQHVQYLESQQQYLEFNDGKQETNLKQGQQGQQKLQNHHISEPEMNQENKKPNQIRSFSREKELLINVSQNPTPNNKKISQSFHSSKNSNKQQMNFIQQLPGTTKYANKKTHYFY